MEQIIKPENCLKCGLYKTSCVITQQGSFIAYKVMGVGNTEAKIMLIGEALGKEETIRQTPFIGAAGERLNQWLEKVGLKREEIYITNTCKCRPPDNRPPKNIEIKSCYPFLLEEINQVKPKIICTLGAIALEAVLGRKGITQIRGNIFKKEINGKEITIIPTYHPAHILRNPGNSKLEEEAIKDLTLVRAISETNNYQQKKQEVNYIYPKTIEEISQYIEKIKEKKIFAYDIETTGFNFLEDSILSISLSADLYESCAFDLRQFTPEEQDEIFVVLKEILESKEILKIGQNCKFDNEFLRTYGVKVKLPLFDTMLAHFLIDENSSHKLKELAWRYTDMGGYEEEMQRVYKEIQKKILLENRERLRESRPGNNSKKEIKKRIEQPIVSKNEAIKITQEELNFTKKVEENKPKQEFKSFYSED